MFRGSLRVTSTEEATPTPRSFLVTVGPHSLEGDLAQGGAEGHTHTTTNFIAETSQV